MTDLKASKRHRRHARIPFGAQIELWKFRTPTPVTAADLSAGGIFLRTREDIAEGSFLTIRIRLAGSRPLSALCKVVRSQSGRSLITRRGLGLSFVDIAPSDRDRIQSYVRERASLSLTPALA